MARPNAQYNIAKPDSLPVRIAGSMRRKMYERFLLDCQVTSDDTILDVGVTSDETYDHSNYLEAWYPHKERIVATGLDQADGLELKHPGVRFVRADGCYLPFANSSFDFVHSSAVLEHVGAFERQARFVSEALRVGRKGIFLTTPNRWFPVEFHTVLPFVHWLPKAVFRRLLLVIGRNFFASEENLNLLTVRDLEKICLSIGASNCRLSSVRLGGLSSNLLLTLVRHID